MSDLTVTISRYDVCALPASHDLHYLHVVTVEHCEPDSWAVRRRGIYCLDSSGQWDVEPRSSERDDDWLSEHRFDEATALRLAHEQARTITCQGVTAEEALRRGSEQ